MTDRSRSRRRPRAAFLAVAIVAAREPPRPAFSYLIMMSHHPRTSSMSAALLVLAAIPASAQPSSSTVPFDLDHNRMTVVVEFPRPGGGVRTARAWVDSGGTGLVMAETLARDLGIDVPAIPAGSEDSVETKSPAPPMRLGRIPLDTEGLNVSVRSGRFAVPGVQAECTLAPRCLRRLHVVLDYPARRLTLAQPGALTPRGARVPCRVNPDTGLFMIDATIDGEKLALGVDNGSAGTWVSAKLTAAWVARHPAWPQAVGAAGSTNFFGFPFETRGTLLALPSLDIGSASVGDVAVLGLDPRLFDWYSKKSAGAVAGFVGADLISRFRVEIDFPGQMTWWQPAPARASRDLDIVGLTLRPEADGSFTVAGVVSKDGRPVVAGIEPGDKLLRVDGFEASGARMGAVIDALRGKPGATRTLVLERAGKRVTVQATVTRLP
jgi:hypothetical protein